MQDRRQAAPCRHDQHPLSIPASRNSALPASGERIRPLAGTTAGVCAGALTALPGSWQVGILRTINLVAGLLG
jgi:hypothetical protein